MAIYSQKPTKAPSLETVVNTGEELLRRFENGKKADGFYSIAHGRGVLYRYGILPQKLFEHRLNQKYIRSYSNRSIQPFHMVQSFDGDYFPREMRAGGDGFFTKRDDIDGCECERFFVSREWYTAGCHRDALYIDKGRINFHAFENKLRMHLRYVQDFLVNENEVEGPFFLMFSLERLDEKALRSVFELPDVRMGPCPVDAVDDEVLISNFLNALRSASHL